MMKNNKQVANGNINAIITQSLIQNEEDEKPNTNVDITKAMEMIVQRFRPCTDDDDELTTIYLTTTELKEIIKAFLGSEPSSELLKLSMENYGFKCIFDCTPNIKPDFYWLLKKRHKPLQINSQH